MTAYHTSTIIDFWFSDEIRPKWYQSTPEFDQLLTERFQDYYDQAIQGTLDHWQQSSDGLLALVIIFDQLPRNMFRNTKQAFATDHMALAMTKFAIEKNFDKSLDVPKKNILYMPFMHSENISEQALGIKYFSQPGLENALDFAERHKVIIEKYGRFPHRNAILGRANTPQEDEYLKTPGAGF